MAPQETQKLEEIREELGEFRGDFRVFVTKMLGDDESENSEGRVPRLEREVGRLKKQVSRHNKIIAGVAGVIIFLKCVSWGAESYRHVLEVIGR
ncbi:hypothetical protein [Edaphobacter albus]|uniref:hypothetical protein n=1 Tax=Edaphobacter sp. 4G125 TaxID=2763071 RepID=UPI0016464C44|nr:hypothetical protein [Edaphobacter sp. 4G125]QNI37537.1 hypothetical protein H7846_04330 [Edaphobacter sp. 4G125]